MTERASPDHVAGDNTRATRWKGQQRMTLEELLIGKEEEGSNGTRFEVTFAGD
jgi:hypothetical protein